MNTNILETEKGYLCSLEGWLDTNAAGELTTQIQP